MNNIQCPFLRKIAGIIACAVFCLVCTETAFANETIDSQARLVLGHGYDLTGSFANSREAKRPAVLNLDRLNADGRVIRDATSRADFRTATGTTIAEYMNDLAIKNGVTIGVEANIFIFSGIFSREASNRFSGERTNQQGFEFATASNVIIRDSYVIGNYDLTRYVNESFVNDVTTMTPEQLLVRYGTHVVLGVELGARIDHDMSVRRIRQTGSATIGDLANTSFNLRFTRGGASVNVDRELASRFGEVFDINSMVVTTNAAGGAGQLARSVHTNQDYTAWDNSIDNNPYAWVGYYDNALIPLYDLIVEERFGARTQALKAGLQEAIYRHLGVHGQSQQHITMVHIPGGSFQMGSPSGDFNNERPVRRVTLSPFFMGRHPVTQSEYEAVMGRNPSHFRGPNRPVEQVSWFDTVEFCNRLSQRESLTPAYTISGSGDNRTVTWNLNANGYRLPTEAEWEYAARGGNGSPGNFTYSGSNSINEVAWHEGNSGGSTQDVGTRRPNALGLYDMSGNVWEWCWDWYGTYPSTAQTDPIGASSGSVRVFRGGSWINSTQGVRSAYRHSFYPSYRYNGLGFRVVRP